MVDFSPLPLSTRCIDGVRIRAREPSSRPTAMFGGDNGRRPTTMAERRNTRTPVFVGSFWWRRDRRGEKGPVETGRLTTVTKRRHSYLLVLSGDANGANIYGRVEGGMPKIGPKVLAEVRDNNAKSDNLPEETTSHIHEACTQRTLSPSSAQSLSRSGWH